jgi:hypothetical protein
MYAALAGAESGYNPYDTTPDSSAAGVMQIIKGTRGELGLSEEDKFDAGKNIAAGTGYLDRQLAASGGDEDTALLMYHYGPGGYKSKVGTPEANTYLQGIHSRESGLQNDTSDLNTLKTFEGQAKTNAGKQAYDAAVNLKNGGGTDALLALSTTVGNATGKFGELITALSNTTEGFKALNKQMPRGTPGSTMNPAFDQYTIQVP